MVHKRPMSELQKKAAIILQLKDDGLRQKFIEIAEHQTPSQTFEQAFDLGCEHFDARTAQQFAKSCRFLAIILRDYGKDDFEHVVSR